MSWIGTTHTHTHTHTHTYIYCLLYRNFKQLKSISISISKYILTFWNKSKKKYLYNQNQFILLMMFFIKLNCKNTKKKQYEKNWRVRCAWARHVCQGFTCFSLKGIVCNSLKQHIARIDRQCLACLLG